jgi:predicted protein tyrosine phosphatase
MKRLVAAAMLICSVRGASADEAAAFGCASSLQPQARMVFDAVMAAPKHTTPLRRVLALTLSELVYGGRLPLSAAEAASDCLRMARNCTDENC